jgi:hypothetical protein
MNQSCDAERKRYWREWELKRLKEEVTEVIDTEAQSYHQHGQSIESQTQCNSTQNHYDWTKSVSTPEVSDESGEEVENQSCKEDRDLETERDRYWKCRESIGSHSSEYTSTSSDHSPTDDPSIWENETPKMETWEHQLRSKLQSEEAWQEFSNTVSGCQVETFEKPLVLQTWHYSWASSWGELEVDSLNANYEV